MAILFVDTVGWLIDGRPIAGQIWITTIIDGLDLIFTSLVCWCWVQYAVYIARGNEKYKIWYKDFSTILFLIQVMLVFSSQIFDFYFYIDSSGVYHRGNGYLIHTLISILLLGYSSFECIRAYARKHKKEQLFIAFIILIPLAGNLFQFFVYGYPTVWICMVFMTLTVYVHIQNKRITVERQEQNDALKKALLEAQTANVAKTEFFSRMSHDMRTPMNGILGMIGLSLDSEDIEEIHDNLFKAESAGEYMLSLINDTLDLQRLESDRMVLNPENVYLKEYIEDIFSMIRISAEQKKTDFRLNNINFDLDRFVKIDKVRVKQIFNNLLSNAIKFTPAGGVVEVTLGLLKQEESRLHMRFTVKDTGVGMSRDFIENRLFKPYAQENNEMTSNLTGSGLGMAITRNLVEIMGGHIEVESEIGEGTVFTVFLDFENVDRQTVEMEKSQSFINNSKLQANLTGRKVLMCEDHPLNAEITRRLLEKAGCAVTWAENGAVGVSKYADSELGYYDVILMDIRMPVLDGIAAARSIRNLNRKDAKKVPIVAMTANAYDSDIKVSLDAGMNMHIAKPIKPEKLYAVIAEVIGNYRG